MALKLPEMKVRVRVLIHPLALWDGTSLKELTVIEPELQSFKVATPVHARVASVQAPHSILLAPGGVRVGLWMTTKESAAGSANPAKSTRLHTVSEAQRVSPVTGASRQTWYEPVSRPVMVNAPVASVVTVVITVPDGVVPVPVLTVIA